VGYLDDGTMVVVEQGRKRIGRSVKLTVTSMLQTSAGRMIFGKLRDDDPGGRTPGAQPRHAAGVDAADGAQTSSDS
jgi:hypothetical protein